MSLGSRSVFFLGFQFDPFTETRAVILFVKEFGKIYSGATNRPQELDEAARRRLSKRLYIPLPSSGANHSSPFSINPFSTHVTN